MAAAGETVGRRRVRGPLASGPSPAPFGRRACQSPASPNRLRAPPPLRPVPLPGKLAIAVGGSYRCRRPDGGGARGAELRAAGRAGISGDGAAAPVALLFVADGGQSDVRRVPVPFRGAGDAAALLAQLLPGLRVRVSGLGGGRPVAAAGPRAGPRGAGGTRTGSGRRRRGGGPSVVPAVQEALPAASRRRGRSAR